MYTSTLTLKFVEGTMPSSASYRTLRVAIGMALHAFVGEIYQCFRAIRQHRSKRNSRFFFNREESTNNSLDEDKRRGQHLDYSGRQEPCVARFSELKAVLFVYISVQFFTLFCIYLPVGMVCLKKKSVSLQKEKKNRSVTRPRIYTFCKLQGVTFPFFQRASPMPHYYKIPLTTTF